MDLNEWLSKAAGDGLTEEKLGANGPNAPKSSSSASDRKGASMEDSTGAVSEAKNVKGMHEGAHAPTDVANDETGMHDALDPVAVGTATMHKAEEGEEDPNADANKPDDEDVEKAEGSRGGNVIGHTSSGKPIYSADHHKAKLGGSKQQYTSASEDRLHGATPGWSAKDHHEVAAHHEKLAGNTVGGSKHKEVANLHRRAAQMKESGKPGKAPKGAASEFHDEKNEKKKKWGLLTNMQGPQQSTKARYDAVDARAGTNRAETAVTKSILPDDDIIEKGFEAIADDLHCNEFFQKGGPYIGARGGKWADPDHKIPWNDKKHASKPSPKAKKHDPEGARELVLFAQNTGALHNQHESIRKNLVNKMASGKYDHAQATKLYGYLLDAASKQYGKEMGDMAGGNSGHAFDPATRNAAAKMFADDFHDDAIAGEFDHHLQKKHQKNNTSPGAAIDSAVAAQRKSDPAMGAAQVASFAGKVQKSETGMSKGLNAMSDWLEKSIGEKGSVSPATTGSAGSSGSVCSCASRGHDGTNGEANLIAHEKNCPLFKLAKALEFKLGRLPTDDELVKAMSGGLYTGDRKKMDEKPGEKGTAEVGRPEDGGKLAGKGGGKGDAPPQGEDKTLASGKPNPGKLDRLSEDDPKSTDKMKSNGMVQKPGEKTDGVEANKKSDKLNKGGQLDDGVHYPVDHEQFEVNRRHAENVSKAMAGEPDMRITHSNPQPVATPEQPQVTEFAKGMVHYSDASDHAAAALAKGDAFYVEGSPTFSLPTPERDDLIHKGPTPLVGTPFQIGPGMRPHREPDLRLGYDGTVIDD